MTRYFAAILCVGLASNAAASDGGSYSGKWLVTAKLPPHFGDTECVALVDDGSAGSKHSGPVTANGDMAENVSGTFQVINGLLVVNLQLGSETGEVVYMSFIARARDGMIGSGLFNEPGYFAAAPLSFGAKGSC